MRKSQELENKLSTLPVDPGVYFYKDAKGEIIYIGKAANLRNRVRQYFQKSRMRDAKTDALVNDISDVDWIVVETELDALFLEAEQIRRNMPKYNILLRDDKSQVYVRISYSSNHPTVTTTRRPLDDGAEYFGPYLSTVAVRKALKYLRRTFPYSTHVVSPKRACLQYQLGLCPGIEEGKTSLEDYRKDLSRLKQYLKGNRRQLLDELDREMKEAAQKQDFEKAAVLRNQLRSLKELKKQIVFSDREALDLSKDQGLYELSSLLSLTKIPRRIEGYDISHMQGSDTVASMVVFINGAPAKDQYRKFKMRIAGNDDFIHINEVMNRRLKRQNTKKWTLPDLFLIDGGKGQLSAAIKACRDQGVTLPIIGLAKRQEEVVIHSESHVQLNGEFTNGKEVIIKHSGPFTIVSLPHSMPVVKLLQRVRDESHRFAVSYHSVLKSKRQTSSIMDNIPSIGPTTRKKLIRNFGSVKAVMGAPEAEIAKVVGNHKAAILKQYLNKIDSINV